MDITVDEECGYDFHHLNEKAEDYADGWQKVCQTIADDERWVQEFFGSQQ